LKLSPLGADLSPERFVCLPISVIDRLTEAVIDHHCHTTNAQAQATAQDAASAGAGQGCAEQLLKMRVVGGVAGGFVIRV
jgi:hypothetical protein